MKGTEISLKTSVKQRVGAAAIAAVMALGLCAVAAPAAHAANGVQSGTQTYDSSNSQWAGAGADETGQGKIDLLYDTTGGTWTDPGTDPSKTKADGDTDGTHDNGTYTVTIPTKIAYEKMAIGTVNTSDDYTVNVKGAIPTGGKVTLTAETGKHLTTGSNDTAKGDDITEATTQGKTEWSAVETFGTLNKDGSLSGTDTTDNIKMTGTAKSTGAYKGTVAYTATPSWSK